MGSYRDKINLSEAQKDSIVSKVVEALEAAKPQTMRRQAAAIPLQEKEQMITQVMNDPTGRGLRRLAYAKRLMA